MLTFRSNIHTHSARYRTKLTSPLSTCGFVCKILSLWAYAVNILIRSNVTNCITSIALIQSPCNSTFKQIFPNLPHSCRSQMFVSVSRLFKQIERVQCTVQRQHDTCPQHLRWTCINLWGRHSSNVSFSIADVDSIIYVQCLKFRDKSSSYLIYDLIWILALGTPKMERFGII